MLARYAAKCGEDTAVDADAILGEYEDADTVSEWAEGDVAYLVSTGVMGSDSPAARRRPDHPRRGRHDGRPSRRRVRLRSDADRPGQPELAS